MANEKGKRCRFEADTAEFVEEPDKPGFVQVTVAKESIVTVAKLVKNKRDLFKNIERFGAGLVDESYVTDSVRHGHLFFRLLTDLTKLEFYRAQLDSAPFSLAHSAQFSAHLHVLRFSKVVGNGNRPKLEPMGPSGPGSKSLWQLTGKSIRRAALP